MNNTETSPIQIVRLWKHPLRQYKNLISRSEGDVSEAVPKARKIISDIRKHGDTAVINYTKKLDDITLSRDSIKIPESEIEKSYGELEDNKIEALKKISDRIRKYHEYQVPSKWMNEFGSGIRAGQLVRPIESVGIYVPGGTAQYPSSVLMTAIPAKVAGVDKTVICTPPNPKGKVNPGTLIAADIAEVDEVYRIGGAQAIGAMAYGTETIPRVEKIIGPGNIYVVAAKIIVSNDVDIDFAAGPSEVLIIADSTANPKQIAMDLIAQAEHDSSAAAVLVTTSERLGERVSELIPEILMETSRKKIAIKSLKKYGRIVITRSLERAFEFANDYAPEHIQLMIRDPKEHINEIKNAGAIFIGKYTPVAAGDIAIGPSHVLPTGGIARRRSGLSVLSFMRMPSVQELTKKGLENISYLIEEICELEGLEAHAKSVRERLK